MYLKHLTGRQYDPGILVISEDHSIVVVLRSFNKVYPLAQVVVVVVSTVAGTESEMSLPIEMVATWVGPSEPRSMTLDCVISSHLVEHQCFPRCRPP